MHLFSLEDEAEIIAAIQDVESKTTGEIRVYVEDFCDVLDPVQRAYEVFETLGMEKTKHRNAVLIYLAEKTRLFAIFGDEGIYKKSGGYPFWKKEKEIFGADLKAATPKIAVLHMIQDIGSELIKHFPTSDIDSNENELPDSIAYGS